MFGGNVDSRLKPARYSQVLSGEQDRNWVVAERIVHRDPYGFKELAQYPNLSTRCWFAPRLCSLSAEQ